MAIRGIFAMVAASSVAGQDLPPQQPTMTATPAQVFVRILSAAKVSLGPDAQLGDQTRTKATITVEDGTKRPAELVEFQ